jgi:hypothetical protein
VKILEERARAAPEATDDQRVKLLYVAGEGRSGSTILGLILGQVEGFFSVGELYYIWDRGLIENRLCSCGVNFSECPVWGRILSHAFGGSDRIDAVELLDLRRRDLRNRHIMFAPTRKSVQARVEQMGEYKGTLEKLYHAVRSVSRGRVIVDSSKEPAYGQVLQDIPSIDLYVLHLVRDSRAVAYSWAFRRKPKMADWNLNDLMVPHGSIETSLFWLGGNLAIERFLRRNPERYMRLRYEDFVEKPLDSVESILRFLGEEAESPFVNEREVSLTVSHTFSGNPDRFHSGTVKIKSDEEWKRKMGRGRQATVTAITWPGLLRYRYPLLPQRAAREAEVSRDAR